MLAELRRRKVMRVAAVYAAVAWAAIEVSQTLSEIFPIAEWILRAIVVGLAVGFPVALILAWAYEIAPHGLMRNGEVAGTASFADERKPQVDLYIVAALAVLGALVIYRFVDQPPTTERAKHQRVFDRFWFRPFRQRRDGFLCL